MAVFDILRAGEIMKLYEFFLVAAAVVAVSVGLVYFLDVFFEDKTNAVMAWFSRLWGDK